MKMILGSIATISLLSAGILQGQGVEVSQAGNKFSKTEVKIRAGQSVTFKNDDTTPHNVFSSDGRKFNLKIQKPGEQKSQKFNKPGEYSVRCAIHPKMKMKVIVE